MPPSRKSLIPVSASLFVDVLVVTAGVLALVSGWRQGAMSSVLSAVGIVAGLVIGFVLAPPVMGVTDSVPLRLLLAVGVVVLLVGVGNLVGATLGGRVRDRMRQRATQRLDSVVGAGFQVVTVLVVVWLMAMPLATGLGPAAASAIRGSVALRALDQVIPDSWGQLPARASAMLSQSGLPPIMEPRGRTPVTVAAPAAEVADPTLVEELRPSVIHILGDSQTCSRRLMGSGFVTAADYVLTNAHVVAGTDSVQLDTVLGMRDAEVVYYEPGVDIAVLYAPDLAIAPLEWAPAPAESGADALVMGYPESGPFEAAPARVSDRITIAGPDIYAEGRVEREAYTVRGSIREGNSGGPLLDMQGRVLGVVFGAAVDESDTGYALTAAEVAQQVGDVTSYTRPVDTQACVA